MDDTKTTVPPKGQTEETKTVPPTPEGGQTKEGQEKALSQSVPDNLKGKTSDDLIKMYGELEHKLGAQGTELGQARKFQEEMAVVLKAIYADDRTKQDVERNMRKVMGISEDSSNKNGETKNTQSDETRKAVEGQIIQDFEGKHGLDTLDPEKKQEVFKKIGDELAEMLDPGGNKTYAQLLDSINLTKLGNMLDKAYFLADRDGIVKKAAESGRMKAIQDRGGIIGNISSSGRSEGKNTLDAEEKLVAGRLGISEEDYLKSKIKGKNQ